MPTSAHYISVNNCKNQRPKAMQPATKYGAHIHMRRKGTLPQRTKVVQPATKQSTGLFLPNLQTNLEQLVVGSSQ